ncbi:MAG: hypothetical protein RIG62_06115 [Cyclobacteriaceae bacterium]
MKQPNSNPQSSVAQFKDHFDSRFARIAYHENTKTVLCELRAEYVPIEHFKDTFYRISELVKNGINEKFIFDKRALRAFHQPSMEWYFIVWKKEMYQYGLHRHRKILPQEPWFRKSVEIARKQIVQTYPDSIIDKLDIQYCETLEDAIAS